MASELQRDKERKSLKATKKIMPNMGTEGNCGKRRSHTGYKINE